MKTRFSLFAIVLLSLPSVYAATPVDLSHASTRILQKFLFDNAFVSAANVQLKETYSDTDAKQTTHTRYREYIHGFRVMGAEAVVHTPHSPKTALVTGTQMNGIIYDNLQADLLTTPANALTEAQKNQALQQAKAEFTKQSPQKHITFQKESAETVVYVDKNKTAHYAFLVSFLVDDKQSGAHRPTSIRDALTGRVYRLWDQVKTEADPMPFPGVNPVAGIGGNVKTGPVIHDGLAGHPSPLMMYSDKSCEFSNDHVRVVDVTYDSEVVATECPVIEGKYNNLPSLDQDENGTRWLQDEMNGGFSPSIDAMYAGTMIYNLYQDWYHIPPLVEKDGKTEMLMVMRVHYGRNFDNAFWNGENMTFGDGGSAFYPLTSLDVAAHEIAHGFTNRHSELGGSMQMAALHESFSDMASVAAVYYATGQAQWALGSNIMKGEGALRYMDDPKKDGESIDHMKNYPENDEDQDPHLLGGVTNKAFYLLSTTQGWDIHKAFDVMVNANLHYWNSSMTTFNEAACGAVGAAKDLGYAVADVKAAFDQVGVETRDCQ